MITFNDLRINDDKDGFYIDCAIEEGHEEQDIWIRKIELINYDNLTSEGTIIDEDRVVTVYEYEESEDPEEETEKITFFAKTVKNGINYDKGLFYIIVTCDGADAPENYQDFVVMPDWQFIYSVGMPYVVQLAAYGINKCEFPAQFEEFAVIWYALQFAFSVCDFSQVELLWKRFLRFASSGASAAGGCPCNQ